MRTYGLLLDCEIVPALAEREAAVDLRRQSSPLQLLWTLDDG